MDWQYMRDDLYVYYHYANTNTTDVLTLHVY